MSVRVCVRGFVGSCARVWFPTSICMHVQKSPPDVAFEKSLYVRNQATGKSNSNPMRCSPIGPHRPRPVGAFVAAASLIAFCTFCSWHRWQ